VSCYGGVSLVFDKEWIESLIELQKKSQELSNNITWPKELVDMIMQTIQASIKNPTSYLHDYCRKFKNLWNAETQYNYVTSYEPKINITETEKGFLVNAAIPGIKGKSDLCVKVNGNSVTISGKMHNNSDENNILFFNKNIPLPAEIDTQKATGKYSDGILTLHLPKIVEAQSHQIEITFCE